jgi:hypothetical protein
MDEDEEHDRAQREHAGRGVAIPIAAERCFLYPDPGFARSDEMFVTTWLSHST